MKKIPTVIDKCSLCPFCRRIKRPLMGIKCEHFTLDAVQVIPWVTGSQMEIPEWCPLEDAIEVVGRYNPLSEEGIKEAIKLANLAEEKKRAEWNLRVVQGIGPLLNKLDMLARKTLGTGDIITNYMRKERGRL